MEYEDARDDEGGEVKKIRSRQVAGIVLRLCGRGIERKGVTC